jgi:type I restriction enzyme R subunit
MIEPGVVPMPYFIVMFQSRSFAEMLERTIRSYQNRTLAAAEVIAELIKLGEGMRKAQKRGEKLNLTEGEIAFYDALDVNESAVNTRRRNTRTCGNLLQQCNDRLDCAGNSPSEIAVMVKGILRKYGYPPDKQEKATVTVLQQGENTLAKRSQ